jgi:hypothetical protein
MKLFFTNPHNIDLLFAKINKKSFLFTIYCSMALPVTRDLYRPAFNEAKRHNGKSRILPALVVLAIIIKPLN